MRPQETFTFFVVSASFFVALTASAQSSFELEGVARDNDGKVIHGTFDITLRVARGSDTTCTLYKETHTGVQSDSLGFFTLVAGSQTHTGFPNIDEVISNSFQQTCFNASNISSGTFVPSSTEKREIHIAVTYNSATYNVGSMTISPVPVAAEAARIGAHSASSIMRVEDGAGAPVAKSAITSAQFDNLVPLYSTSAAQANHLFGVTGAGAPKAKQLLYSGAVTITQDDNTITIGSSAGAGTVTSVSAAGGSPLGVSNGTTSPVISITQASASQSGYLSSSDFNSFSGKQAAGNYITALTGEITATGPGSVAGTITNGAVTTAKIADGNVTALKLATDAVTSAKIMDQNVTTTKLGNKAVDFSKFQDIGSNKLLGRHNAGSGAVEEIGIGGNLSLSGGVLNTAATVGTVQNVSAAGGTPLSVSGGTVSPVISILQANASQSGYLSSTDFNTFSGKQAALGFTPISNALATNQVYVGVAGLATAKYFGIADLRGVAGTQQFPACSSSQTLTWNSGTDTLSCTSINNLDGDKITSGTVAAVRLGTGSPSVTTYLRGDGAWATMPTVLSGTTTSTYTLFGVNAGNGATPGNLTAVGASAGAGITGNGNTVMGIQAAALGGAGGANTVIGSFAHYNSALQGNANTVIGGSAQTAAQLGDDNVVIGTSANLNGNYSYSTIVGKSASGGGNGAVAIGWGMSAPANSIVIGTADSGGVARERLRVDGAGNVGIGTTSPGHKLDVNGQTGFRGGYIEYSTTLTGSGAVALTDYSSNIFTVLPSSTGSYQIELPPLTGLPANGVWSATFYVKNALAGTVNFQIIGNAATSMTRIWDVSSAPSMGSTPMSIASGKTVIFSCMVVKNVSTAFCAASGSN